MTAILGTTAFTAAKADATPNWMLSSSEAAGPGLPMELTTKAETTLNLLSKALGAKVEISCEKVALDEGLLETEGKGHGTLLFSGCQTRLNGTISTECKPAEPVSAKVKSQLVLHEGSTLARIEPVTGTVLASLKAGSECSIGTSINIIGAFYAKDSKFEAIQEAHTLEEGPLTELWILSKTAEHKATVDGSASVSLAGAHLYRWWSGSGATPNWMLSSSEAAGPGLPMELTTKAETTLNLLSKALGAKVEISCEKVALDEGLLETEGKGHGTLLFSGCQTRLNGTISTECKPAEPVSAKVKSQLVPHEGSTLARIEPATGTTFTTLSAGVECALGTKSRSLASSMPKTVMGNSKL